MRGSLISVVVVLLLVVVIKAKPEYQDTQYPADTRDRTVKEAAEMAAEKILSDHKWEGNLNVILSAYRQVGHGFLYTIELELLTEYELIHYIAKVTKDFAHNLAVESYALGNRRRWRPDKRLGAKQKEELAKKLHRDEL